MVTALRNEIRRMYRVKDGIDGFKLEFAINLFDRLNALEEPACHILDQYQEDRCRMKGYLKALEEEFEFGVKFGVLEKIS